MMRRDMKYPAHPVLVALLLASCALSENSHTNEGAGDPVMPGPNAAATDSEGAEPTNTGNQVGSPNGNLVKSGGRVVVNLGPFKNLESVDPLAYIYLRGTPGISPDRTYLSASIMDGRAHIRLRFEVEYTGESTPIALVKHGYLSIQNGKTESFATAGTLAVSEDTPDRLRLLFSNVEMAEASTTAPGTMGASAPMEDGTLVGDVVRACLGPGGGSVDANNPFCATP
jgi:hypothetical protein